jgi:predicted O-methyltransferase YrrM
MNFLDPLLESYVNAHTRPENNALQTINRDTHLHVVGPRMLSGHLQGQVLRMISLMIRPKRILEIGTFTGYSAICLSEGLQEGGTLTTIDINEELEKRVRSNFRLAGVEQKIDYRIGDALEIIPTLEGPFDMVFIDADKHNYRNYYELVWSKVPVGGWILADNVLWSGRILFDRPKMDLDTAAIYDFNAFVQDDPRIENVLFPIRDGMMVMRKVKE